MNRHALPALAAALALAGCAQADTEQPADWPTPDRPTADQAADDYVDAIVADGWPAYDYAAPELRAAIRRGDFEKVQQVCAPTPPDYFDVRTIAENGDTATVVADRAGTEVTFRLAYKDGAWWWLPDDMDRWKRPPADLIAECL